MSPHAHLRAHPPRAIAGALALVAIALPAVALASASSAETPGAPATMHVADRRLAYGQAILATGRVPRSEARRRVVLELAPPGRSWRAIGAGRVGRDGRYRVRVLARLSGQVRVRLDDGGRPRAAGAPAAPRPSRAQRVAVAARLLAGFRRLQVLSGARAGVSGAVLPRRGGRRVQLEVARRGRWHAIARARTSRYGRFTVRLTARGLGSSPVRLRFTGDRFNGGAARPAGRLEVFRISQASWYQLTGGALACGGRMGPRTLGVANKTLPCGTRVTIRYRGRSVRVPVIDRGPFSGNREWDLSGEVARRLHFDGVGAVWSSR